MMFLALDWLMIKILIRQECFLVRLLRNHMIKGGAEGQLLVPRYVPWTSSWRKSYAFLPLQEFGIHSSVFFLVPWGWRAQSRSFDYYTIDLFSPRDSFPICHNQIPFSLCILQCLFTSKMAVWNLRRNCGSQNRRRSHLQFAQLPLEATKEVELG